MSQEHGGFDGFARLASMPPLRSEEFPTMSPLFVKMMSKMAPLPVGQGPAPDAKKRICIVGGGIAGLACANQLKTDPQGRFDVTLFEAEDRLGGAVRTVVTPDPQGNPVVVDTGVVFTEENFYPNLYKLFSLPEFKTETEAVQLGMAASFRSADGREEVWSNVIPALPLRKKFKAESNRFMLELANIEGVGNPLRMFGTTAGEWLKEQGYSDEFVQKSVIPLLLTFAITRNGLLGVPLAILHLYFGGGALSFNSAGYGRRAAHGMHTYIDKFAAALGDTAKTGHRVTAISRRADGNGVDVTVVANGVTKTEHFDEVVVAVYKDIALQLLGDSASLAEKEMFKRIQYEEMDVYVHNDPNVLSPALKGPDGTWRYQCFNYRYLGSDFGNYVRGTTTYVPRFDPDEPSKEVPLPLLTYANANDEGTAGVVLPAKDKIVDRHRFRHVIQNREMFMSGAALHTVNGKDRIWYCGNDTVINFHEGALCSGLIIAKALGVPYPFVHDPKQAWVYNLFEAYMLKGQLPMELLYLNPH